MKKDVLIRVRGLQMMDTEDEQEPLEIVVPGQYYYCLLYTSLCKVGANRFHFIFGIRIAVWHPVYNFIEIIMFLSLIHICHGALLI